MTEQTVGLDEREQNLVAEKLSAIGPYRLLDVVGQGGMGAVYRARQLQPIERDVAIKVTRVDLTSTGLLARFEAERQMLAELSHPNIAAVYDGGETADGHPYLVMEYIDGLTVTQFCDQNKLNLTDRLGIFCDLCEAVQYMHQRGIIHRDLKPTNVLVSDVSGKPVTKLIDFGIAKLVNDQSGATRAQQSLGTPSYMSPEQRLTPAAVDTRSDIFALGLVLYELLVGELPFDSELAAAAFVDGQITRPSTLWRQLAGDRQTQLAVWRSTSAGSIHKQLAGDLDWVALRAADADPDRRYPTAAALASDVQQFLAGYAVAAKPPSTWYSLSKLVRRHRFESIAAVLLVLGLAAAMTTTTRALFAEQQARAAADREYARSSAVNTFLLELLESPDPRQRGQDVRVVDLLDEAVEKAMTNFTEQPTVRAALLEALGQSYAGLGQREQADTLFADALAILDKDASHDPVAPLRVANLRSENGGQGLAPAELVLERETLLTRARAQLGDEDRLTMTLVNNLAFAYYSLGYEQDDAESSQRALDYFAENLALRERVLGPRHPDATHARNNLASVLLGADEHAQALPLFMKNYEVQQEVFGLENYYTLSTMNSIGVTHYEQGRVVEAIDWVRRSLTGQQRVSGPTHQVTLSTAIYLADLYQAAGETENYIATLSDIVQVAPAEAKIHQQAQQRLADSQAASPSGANQ